MSDLAPDFHPPCIIFISSNNNEMMYLVDAIAIICRYCWAGYWILGTNITHNILSLQTDVCMYDKIITTTIIPSYIDICTLHTHTEGEDCA